MGARLKLVQICDHSRYDANRAEDTPIALHVDDVSSQPVTSKAWNVKERMKDTSCVPTIRPAAGPGSHYLSVANGHWRRVHRP
jgi:hypothetical protein